MQKKLGLSRQKIIDAAIEMADSEGLSKLSMRNLARHLGVEAMSLYHHLRHKAELLDALVDEIFSRMSWDSDKEDWIEVMHNRALAMRQCLRQHHWAIGLLDSRKNPGESTLAHHDRVLGVLRQAGFSLSLAAAAYSLMDSYIYGFLLQEQSLPASTDSELQQLAYEMAKHFPKDKYPYLAELTFDYVLKPDYSFEGEFLRGLTFILQSLEEARKAEAL